MNLFIDIGSTSIKWGLENKLKIVSKGQEDFLPPNYFDEFKHEIDADKIVEVIKKLISKFDSLKNICFSVQMHGYVLVENENSRNVYVSWRDRRSLKDYRVGVTYYDEFIKNFSNAFNLNSGTALKANLCPISIYSNALSQSKSSLNGEIYSLGSYIVKCLTGNNVSHITDVCALGFYDVHGNINKQLTTSKSFFSGISLPNPKSEFCVAGTYNNINIFTPVGDQQATVYSLNKNGYILNTGTATQLCMISDIYLNKIGIESRPFFYGKYLLTITGLLGGQAIRDWLESGKGNEFIIKNLQDNYSKNIKLLPKENNLYVCGGAGLYHKKIFSKALKELKIEYEFTECNAIDGLQKLLSTFKQ